VLERQRSRLLREDPWPDATALSQELYAMFTDDQPLQVPGVEANPAPGVIPYTVNYPPGEDNVPMMSINRGSDSFDLSIGPSGLTFEVNGQPAPIIAVVPKKTTSSGNVFAGQITGYIGSNIYQVDVYPNGRSQSPVSIEVEQLEGDPAFPHDNGRWATVIEEPDGGFSMNVPVWG
jgi:hypothetical protein